MQLESENFLKMILEFCIYSPGLFFHKCVIVEFTLQTACSKTSTMQITQYRINKYPWLPNIPL